MRTQFDPKDLVRPEMQRAEAALRSCVHCGLCNPNCPTYGLLGDELDGPRGRIQLMQNMLEKNAVPSAETVKHLDRCLGCLGCKASCPSGVDYSQLLDTARAHVEATYTRPPGERLHRSLVAAVLTRPFVSRPLAALARVGRPLVRFLPQRLRAMASRAPTASFASALKPGIYRAQGQRKMRVALLRGCIQQIAGAEIDQATVRLLTRLGAEVVVLPATGCCGGIHWHMGKRNAARKRGRRNLASWSKELDGEGLDAVIANATGCTTMLAGYAHMFEEVDGWSFRARKIAALVKDVTSIVEMLGMPQQAAIARPIVAWHPPCSMQHGLQLGDLGERLLAQAGFGVRLAAESHMCCGSAGTYSLTEPGIASALGDKKAGHLNATGAALLASANFGCMDHLRGKLSMPAVHIVELLDWATGGPKPPRLHITPSPSPSRSGVA